MLQGLLNLDGGVLLWIQEWVRSGLLTPLVTVYTHLGDSGMLWIALSVLLLCFKKTRKAGVVSLLALLLSLIFTNGILKHLVARTRPWLTVEGLVPLIAEHDPNSFPSGHTSASFAAASAWWRTLPRRWMKVTAVVLAALMALSRLYVGVHFPSDVLALDLEQALDAAARLLTPPQCAGAGFAPFRPKAKGTPLAKKQ